MTLHMVLKYGEHKAPPPGTIAIHSNIMKEFGTVWMGKWGKSTGKPFIRILKKQIDSDLPTYVFLTKHAAQKYTVHAGCLEAVDTKVDDENLIPSYYLDRKPYIRTWFKISKLTQLSPDIFDELIGFSSRMPISKTLKKTMSGVLYVLLQPHQQIEDFIYEEKRL
jgi:hypothetical protein